MFVDDHLPTIDVDDANLLNLSFLILFKNTFRMFSRRASLSPSTSVGSSRIVSFLLSNKFKLIEWEQFRSVRITSSVD